MFFSIFAVIFGGRGGQATPRVEVAVVDEDRSGALARAWSRRSQRSRRLEVRTHRRRTTRAGTEKPLDRERARALVRGGDVPVAVVLPAGFGAGGMSFAPGTRVAVILLADPADPVAPQMVGGLLQKVAMTAAPDVMARTGIERVRALRRRPHARAATLDRRLAAEAQGAGRARPAARPAGAADGGAGMSGLIATEVVDVLREGRADKGIISFYAAGIAVMFLLFTAPAPAARCSTSRRPARSSACSRSRVGMSRLLAGKWLYLTAARRACRSP